ncbi:MAG: TerB family tellurite resistance protein [Myxococcales bacterium]|nr:TerB family tellurite resistance protein [Myxococcales bacterium]
METRARDVIAGTLRPNDPRRFLVEAMIGAMNSDGEVDQRERDVLQRYIDQHEMFAGVTPTNAKLLLEMATDAVNFAGSATARIPAIARGLPARLHRITAMAMACEVCVADEILHEGELTFLEQLRLALRIAPYEAQDIFAAAQGHRTAAYIDDRLLRLRTLVGVAVELFTLRAVTLGKLIDDHRFELRDFLVAIPDLALRAHEIEGLLYQAFRKPRMTGPDSELVSLASGLPDAVDRYWMVVYAMCAEPPADLARWRVIPFISLAQRAFGIGDADMELAAADAATFPANLPRPR